MRKWLKYISGVLAGMLYVSVAVSAGDDRVVETFTGETTVSIYLRDMDDETDLEAQIGTSVAKITETTKLEEGTIPVKTLIMLDNSVSIKKAQQEQIMELVQDLIGGAMEQEQIALATFGEELHYLTEYTSDYGELKQALTGLTYGDQETWLTDVLYDILSKEDWKDGEENFFRIVIISDGVDNKPVGVTKEELYQYMADCRVPIYTIGCGGKNNEEALENMFALARISGTQPYLLDEVENTLDIVHVLAADGSILRVRIAPAPEELDGAVKTVRITAGDTDIQTEMRMPQQALPEEPETEAVSKPAPASQPQPVSPAPVADAAPKASFPLPVLLVCGLLGLAVCLVIMGVILLFRKKRGHTAAGFESYTGREENGSVRSSSTVLIGGNSRKYDLTLTDMQNSARSFRTQISETAAAMIGRNESCDICIHDDDRISGKHCEIGIRDNHFYVQDLHSSNGTFLNDSRVITDSELIAGNILRLGAAQFRVNIH